MQSQPCRVGAGRQRDGELSAGGDVDVQPLGRHPAHRLGAQEGLARVVHRGARAVARGCCIERLPHLASAVAHGDLVDHVQRRAEAVPKIGDRNATESEGAVFGSPGVRRPHLLGQRVHVGRDDGCGGRVRRGGHGWRANRWFGECAGAGSGGQGDVDACSLGHAPARLRRVTIRRAPTRSRVRCSEKHVTARESTHCGVCRGERCFSDAPDGGRERVATGQWPPWAGIRWWAMCGYAPTRPAPPTSVTCGCGCPPTSDGRTTRPPRVRSSTLTQGDRDAIGLDTLPKTLAGALDLLDASATMRAAHGDDMVDLYLAVRRAA